MKVLWFSNISLTEDGIAKSGTWIYSMFKGLRTSIDVDVVANISFSNTKKFILSDSGNFKEFLVPISLGQSIDSISETVINRIIDFVDAISPDIIHIWGIEGPWATICQEKLDRYYQLIEIQGFKGITGKPIHFNGGLNRLPCNLLHSLEWLVPRYSLSSRQKEFKNWDYQEQRVVSKAKYISVQSNWVKDALRFHFNTKARLFNTSILLRNSFIHPVQWTIPQKREDQTPILFTTTSPVPYKGLHVLIETVMLLKRYYPNIRLRVAGISINNRNRKSSGYIRLIDNLISSYGLKDNVDLLGNLTEELILQELYKCDIFVNPTFIETFCLALAEALSVGVPTVSSYVAAIPELVDGQNGLLVPAGDSISLASTIDKILTDSCLGKKLSDMAYETMSSYNNSQRIIEKQIDIYKSILNS